MEKIPVYFIVCTQCGNVVGGPFLTENDARVAALSMKKCPRCKANFSVNLSTGGTWNFTIVEESMSSADDVVKLIRKYFNIEKSQLIFGYRDAGPGSPDYRYQSIKIIFKRHDRTDRASPAVCIYILDKDKQKIIDGFCFDNPYALVQLACESILSAKWLKDKIKIQ